MISFRLLSFARYSHFHGYRGGGGSSLPPHHHCPLQPVVVVESPLSIKFDFEVSNRGCEKDWVLSWIGSHHCGAVWWF
ncbi:hypothetical protein Syun_011590 [Stephania yunnanensis]|uniref:Uncharacterized protein n=1 Tax=Stephania yunnanensis TaxID=152371 RepID=A0AAP0JYV3_9MAGN